MMSGVSMSKIKQVRVWDKAHEALKKLADKLADEKGLSDVSMTDACSIAIIEALERREMEAEPSGTVA